ncbi:MAG: flagellar FliJ family protein [Melioribacteraceae bacterium]|nr:flagellar FliJ family protein [Melioribacteraceae bacterium]
MAGFKYKFDSIHRIKDKLKVKAQRELAEINLKIEQKKQKIEQTREEYRQTKTMLRSGNFKVHEIHYYERHGIFLNGMIKRFKAELEFLEKKKVKKLIELTNKAKEEKMFELLKEKHYQQYMKEQLKTENTFLDELAIQKTGRK